MTPEDFRSCLEAAERGRLFTDRGAGDEVQAALVAVAESAPSVPPALVDAARRAFAAQRSKRP